MRTELCSFTGFKIYPGHGHTFIRGDGKTFQFINYKAAALFAGKKNPRKIRWTQVYRRLHKGGSDQKKKRKTRRTTKVQRAIVGASLDVIRARKNQKPEVRRQERQRALRELRERKKGQRKSAKGSGRFGGVRVKAQKLQGPKGGR